MTSVLSFKVASSSSSWQQELIRAHHYFPSTSLASTSLKKPSLAFKEVVTESFFQKIRHAGDPIALQVLESPTKPIKPLPQNVMSWQEDPVGDREAFIRSGLIKKYHGRILLLVTGVCPVHCRYCFRQHFPYVKNVFSMQHLEGVMQLIREDTSLSEVILSGGDPLSLSDTILDTLLTSLMKVMHVRTLRVHTRYATTLPKRFTASLYDALGAWKRHKVFVSHINHAKELDAESAAIFKRLLHEGWTVLNQSVLLKNVNDTLDSLKNLSQGLWEQKVLPYYLHQLDPVRGAERFYVSHHKGRLLIKRLRAELPGYLVPRYVMEVKNASAKIPL